MCMEDVRIYRRTGFDTTFYVVSTSTPVLIAPYSPNRVALCFSPPSSNFYTISQSSGVADGQGLVIAGNTSPFTMTIQQHGAMVFGPWYAITHGSQYNIGVSEVMLLED